MLATASLELKAEKQSAHSNYVRSVAFSPDGASIVSGSWDETIKVWDACATALTPTPISSKSEHPLACRSFPGAQGGEAKRAQPRGDVRGLFPRWRDHRVGLQRQDDQSLGCRCVGTDTHPKILQI